MRPVIGFRYQPLSKMVAHGKPSQCISRKHNVTTFKVIMCNTIYLGLFLPLSEDSSVPFLLPQHS